MTEERKIDLAFDGVVQNIVSECRDIVEDSAHVYDGIDNLKSLIQEYDSLLTEYHSFKLNNEREMETLADTLTQRLREQLSL